MTDRSTRRRGGGLPRNSAEDATVVTPTPHPDQPPYEHVDGSDDADLHRHDGGLPHAHADPPHWHDGDQVVPLHDYPAADDAALYGTDPNPDNPPYERPRLDGPYDVEGVPSDANAAASALPAPDHDDTADDGEKAGQADPDTDEIARFVEKTRSLPPEEQQQVKANLRGVLATIDGSAPPAQPAPAPVSDKAATRPGATIADPVADSGLDTILHRYQDPLLQHEMTWNRTLVRAAMQMATHHADNGPADPPELAPKDLVYSVRDAVQQIVSNREQADPDA